ncbi:MAG TPA: low molecular weight protein-tyrosine-phosphatase [Microthrixaceae bacterium]|nr:low molecular weight protein-tyrosine-phosphatase [Microthrixaceae bacterium]
MDLLFVCLGNICRSPTAEAVMSALVADAGLDGEIRCDSAGTGGWHVGDLPDRRARDEARRHGIEMTHRGWQVRTSADLERFDLVLAMDHSNLADLRRMAPAGWDDARISLLRSFDPVAGDDEVPDPYYGDADEFAEVFAICQTACRGLLEHLRPHLGSGPGR